MKNAILFLFFIGATALSAQSISKNALGIRVGDNDGFGGEISYQRYLHENNRLEFDLGWRDSDNVEAFKLVGLYQWVMPIDGGFNWYVGAGGGVGSFDAGENDGAFALIAGDIGIEYDFNIPLLISLDMRPEIGFNDNYSDDLDLDIALGLRYQF
ncbi:hypothetical protein K1F50_05040 [Muricauda oceani]|uniref:Outer membrane protein beta-barrel domain-containing protein n=1 Tax=Flagellimonas oceani TaxID=2698672 RepID=A0A6G7J5Q6_9FLAO|nr:hypothetical protein [Allomuricauda oceani]MBW8242154.1 hypothetical protein [Allomuricauda oceani]QII45918.1 hypothetical protein GVT53_14965 [Allomuricauda oceani]